MPSGSSRQSEPSDHQAPKNESVIESMIAKLLILFFCAFFFLCFRCGSFRRTSVVGQFEILMACSPSMASS